MYAGLVIHSEQNVKQMTGVRSACVLLSCQALRG